MLRFDPQKKKKKDEMKFKLRWMIFAHNSYESLNLPDFIVIVW